MADGSRAMAMWHSLLEPTRCQPALDLEGTYVVATSFCIYTVAGQS